MATMIMKNLRTPRVLNRHTAGWAVGVGAVSTLLIPMFRALADRFRIATLRKNPKMDTEFTGAYPRGSGAFNEVIGGHPEDMNAMPSSCDFSPAMPPVEDGSELERG